MSGTEILMIVIFAVIVVIVWAHGVMSKKELDERYGKQLKQAYQDYYDLEKKYNELKKKLEDNDENV